MEKTVKIGSNLVRLSNNISFAMIYRNQFGVDIIPAFTPMVAAAFDVITGIMNSADDINDLTVGSVLKNFDGDAAIEAIAHLSGLELVDFINITWAMAKACDDSLPDPATWARGLDSFHLDEIAPEVFKLLARSLVSSKNLVRLTGILNKVKKDQPLTLKPLSSPESSEG